MTATVAVANLLLDFDELDRLLRAHMDEDDPDPLDAFLLAAGLAQIVEDYVHRDALALGTIGERIAGARRPALALRAAAVALRGAAPGERNARTLAVRLESAVGLLAEAVVHGVPPPHAVPLRARLPRSLRREVMRLPNSFRAFDQRPEDCGALVERFAVSGDRNQPLVVLGVRTSGSYLAPLTASYLRDAGFVSVETLTYRPGRPLLRRDRMRLRRAAAAGARVLVVDDPPRSGSVLARTSRELVALGVPEQSLVLLLALFTEEPPEALRHLQLVTLPWSQWAVHAQLGQPSPAERAHVRAVGTAGDQQVLVRGVGLGYLGRQAEAVARALAAYVPDIVGFHDGLLEREWLPDRLRAVQRDETLAQLLAGYIAFRARALRVGEDASLRLVGRDALWQHVAELLESCFGRARVAARPLLRRASRRLATPRVPSVVDGATELENLFVLPDGTLRKVGFEERPFAASGLNVYTCDPLFDVAVAAADADDEGFAAALRRAYEHETGEPVLPERLLLYRLAYAANARWHSRGSLDRLLAIERATSRAVAGYFAERYLADAGAPPTGDLCAIDIDGVLETRLLTAPALGPDGALALRALARHGFRAVIATGRSLPELRERCDAYGLAGGIAEYGAFVWNGRAASLLAPDAADALGAVRTTLAREPSVVVDEGFAGSVRAYSRGHNGSRGPLGAEQERAALAVAPGVTAIRGDLQTDFVAGVDKGAGLLELTRLLDAPVVFAIGDAEADLPMLALAEHAYAPAAASPALRAEARVVRHEYQAGLLDAVAAFLGHRPERCRVCAPPRLPPEGRLIAAALRAKDGGAFVKLFQLARVAFDQRLSTTSR